MDRPDFALVGPGRLGTRIARALVEAGLRCRAIRGHGRPPGPEDNIVPECRIFDTHTDPLPWPPVDLVLIAVQDREIAGAALQLASQELTPGTVVLHTSGLHTSALLDPCRETGAAVGSWHPLQTFPEGDRAVTLDGVWCAIEGDPPAMAAAEDLSHALGMRPWRIDPAAKPRYHAAASVAANLTHVLQVAAGRLLGGAGIPADPPGSALEPLVLASLHAAFEAEGLEQLTGPLARGDHDTLQRQLAALPPEVAKVYETVIDLVSRWETMNW